MFQPQVIERALKHALRVFGILLMLIGAVSILLHWGVVAGVAVVLAALDGLVLLMYWIEERSALRRERQSGQAQRRAGAMAGTMTSRKQRKSFMV